MSRSAWLLVNGTDRSRANSSTWASRSRRRSSRLRVLDWRRPGARRCSASPTRRAWRHESSNGSAISEGIAGSCWSRAWWAAVLSPYSARSALLGPGLVRVGLAGRDQFAADVRAAQSVPGLVVGVVDRQGVVDHRSTERGQHVEL